MKFLNYLFVGLIVLATVSGMGAFVLNRNAPVEVVACPMDARMCPDGTAVGRTGPNCEFAACSNSESGSTISDYYQKQIDTHADRIVVTSPRPSDTITSPVTITGMARGPWFFEGSFSVSVVDWNRVVIGEGIATANGEWMTENFVPFTATIHFTKSSPDPHGFLILRKDNPSGLPENDDALEIPVRF